MIRASTSLLYTSTLYEDDKDQDYDKEVTRKCLGKLLKTHSELLYKLVSYL